MRQNDALNRAVVRSRSCGRCSTAAFSASMVCRCRSAAPWLSRWPSRCSRAAAATATAVEESVGLVAERFRPRCLGCSAAGISMSSSANQCRPRSPYARRPQPVAQPLSLRSPPRRWCRSATPSTGRLRRDAPHQLRRPAACRGCRVSG